MDSNNRMEPTACAKIHACGHEDKSILTNKWKERGPFMKFCGTLSLGFTALLLAGVSTYKKNRGLNFQ